ncbi:MAG: alpha/beta fold hydrolase [Desulfobacterales bacterium]|nr:alpha/beta fold hydrolase [Desulfobacterales bacterium]
MEKTIFFNDAEVRLEGRLLMASPKQAVVITHPHPLYGGDMDNGVVTAIAEAYNQEGWSTLRFNFRGTGRSSGHHEDGIGEQVDVQAAITCLKNLGFQRIDLAGYSFGAWVLAAWARSAGDHPHRLLLVAPPVAFIDFTKMTIPGLHHVFTGSLDDLAPPGQINLALPHWHAQARLSVIQGADHSFWGHFQTLEREIAAAIG